MKKKIEGEKVLENKLRKAVLKLGGWSIKLLCTYVTGLPDRLCLFPQGRVLFVEVKTTNKKPTARQLLIHGKLRKLGFRVLVVDTSEGIAEALKQYAPEDDDDLLL